MKRFFSPANPLIQIINLVEDPPPSRIGTKTSTLHYRAVHVKRMYLYTGNGMCYNVHFQIKTIEEFAVQLCDHFLRKYNHVTDARVYIEQKPWSRVKQVTQWVISLHEQMYSLTVCY